MSARMMCVHPEADDAPWESAMLRTGRPTGCGVATVAYSLTYQEMVLLEHFSPPAWEVKPTSESFKVRKCQSEAPQPHIQCQPATTIATATGHSRNLMSSLLQQEAQVDMQQELRALADDLGSLEEDLSFAPAAVPDESKTKPKPKPEELNDAKKISQHRSKSTSYLLTHEDIDKATNTKAFDASTVMDLSPMSPKKAMTFRAAAEEQNPVVSESAEVLLHIYEMGELSPGVQKMLTTVLGKSAFHVGLEIYGVEWSFGQRTSPRMSGITSSRFPKKNPCHRYKETLSLGRTSMSPKQVHSLLLDMDCIWMAAEYHPLRRNCVNFAEELCHRLGVQQPPVYLGALSRGLKNVLFV